MPTNFVRCADVQTTGLLEQPVLLMAPADPSGRRWLEDVQGRAVGFAWHPLVSWWLRWLGAPLVVHEADEEPVVFGVRRLWTLLPRWLVADADDEAVGTLAGAWLLDRWDRPLICRCPAPDGVSGTFEAPPDQKVADWCRAGERVRLTFHPVVRDQPFLKMLMLAAVLMATRDGA